MMLSQIKSTLLQLMQIIDTAERKAFLPYEKSMYVLMTRSPAAFYTAASEDNEVMKLYQNKIFGYLADRRYSGKQLECDIFLKSKDNSWDDNISTCITIDHATSLEKTLEELKTSDPVILEKILKENNSSDPDLDADDIKIYFNCSYTKIADYLVKLGLLNIEEVINDCPEPLSDEDSENDLSSKESDDDENMMQHEKLKGSAINKNSEIHFAYRFNIANLVTYNALFQHAEWKKSIVNSITTILDAPIASQLAVNKAAYELKLEENVKLEQSQPTNTAFKP